MVEHWVVAPVVEGSSPFTHPIPLTENEGEKSPFSLFNHFFEILGSPYALRREGPAYWNMCSFMNNPG